MHHEREHGDQIVFRVVQQLAPYWDISIYHKQYSGLPFANTNYNLGRLKISAFLRVKHLLQAHNGESKRYFSD